MKTISIKGMHCMHCVSSVTEALKAVEGVTSVTVNLEAQNAIVEGTATDVALKEAVEDTGFDVVSIQ